MTYAVRCCETSEAEQVVALLDRELGEGLHDLEETREQMTFGGVIGAFEDGHLIGAGTAGILGDHWLRDMLVETETFDGAIGLLHSVAVLPDRRGQGIGRSLAVARIENLEALGCVAVAALSWESGQKGRSRPVLEKLGFRMVRRIERPWAGRSCPICGPDCGCDSVLMLLRIS